MKTLLFGALLIVGQAVAADAVTLAGRDPATEAERDFYAGDKRYIAVPVCPGAASWVVPGWPAKDADAGKAAAEMGRRPFSCKDLGDDPKQKRAMEVTTFATTYNVRMRTLNGLATR
jgi:hypothetical protein